MAHPGIVRMKALARQHVYWPRLDLEIERMVRHFAGPCSDGHSYLILIDSFSKWPEVYRMDRISTAATLQVLRSIVYRLGFPEEIVSDNGTQFHAAEFKEFCDEFGIKHTFTPPYHPQSNGQAERFVDTFKRAMKKCAKDGKFWAEKMLLAYRTTPNSALNRLSPDQLFFGRRLRTQLSLVHPKEEQAEVIDPAKIRKSQADYARKMARQFDVPHLSCPRSGSRKERGIFLGKNNIIEMKRERMEANDTTTTDSSPSSTSYKRQRIHSERIPIKAEQLDGMSATNAQPQNFAVRQQSAGKRRALNRDFATKLASITLTSGELCRLDALFGGAVGTDQLEQFNRAVSGCLCRLGRHAVDQRNDVIALIGAVVGPVDLHQVAFPRRRIFVFQLGYFEFEQIAEQKPDLVDYGPWMADMDIQGLPLPSDEFIEQKAQMLQSFLADSACQQQQHFERVSVRQSVKMEHHHDSSALDSNNQAASISTTTTSRRTTTVAKDHGNNGVQLQQHQDDAGDDNDDDDDDVQVLELATASTNTNSRDMEDSDGDMENGRQQQQQQASGGEQLEHDEEDDDDRDSEQDSDNDNEIDEPPLDELVHSTELLKRVRVTLSSLRQLVSLEPFRHSLVGCLVACRVKKTPKENKKNKNNDENFGVIVDEIVQIDCEQLLFKHTSSAPLPLDKLTDNGITDTVFRDWIDNLTKWGETLPLFSLYRQRRCALYDQLRKLKKSQKLSRAQRRKLRRAKKELGTNSQLLQQIKMTKKDVPKAVVVTHQPQLLLQPNHQTKPKPVYGETFIREFGQIFVLPRELVQLHELGKSVFDRVAVGLYVKQHHCPWVEQITRVSLGAKPYTIAQNKMDFVKRHLFNNNNNDDNDISEQQRPNNESNVPIQIKFDPPTVDYVRRKSQQLRDTLKKRKTQLANGPPKT
ncbi:hypothetical protein niasHT_005846 [Heterodera trifolii]|uniref:Integrase catalytic domain-containing protein n=1 Tax=Heterodera trifolii TaxID=157864 RepID=A0ABD2MCH8_9BILA